MAERKATRIAARAGFELVPVAGPDGTIGAVELPVELSGWTQRDMAEAAVDFAVAPRHVAPNIAATHAARAIVQRSGRGIEWLRARLYDREPDVHTLTKQLLAARLAA